MPDFITVCLICQKELSRKKTMAYPHDVRSTGGVCKSLICQNKLAKMYAGYFKKRKAAKGRL